MGIAVEPPDINVSDANFTPHGSAIRFGLAAVKNVGHNAIESIVAGRKKLGQYRDIFEFAEKVDLRLLNKRVLESLIKSGAMDSFGHRAQLMFVLDKVVGRAEKTRRDAEMGQHGLFLDIFAQAQESEAESEKLPDIPHWDEHQRLAAEKEILGFFITGHPLEKYRDKLEGLSALGVSEICALKASTGKDETTAVRDDVKVFGARMPHLLLEPAGVKRWGESSEKNFRDYAEFLLKWGVVKQKVDVHDLITNELIDEINRFDAAKIAADAKTYTYGR